MKRDVLYKKRRNWTLKLVMKTIKKLNRKKNRINFNLQRIKYDIEKMYKI